MKEITKETLCAGLGHQWSEIERRCVLCGTTPLSTKADQRIEIVKGLVREGLIKPEDAQSLLEFPELEIPFKIGRPAGPNDPIPRLRDIDWPIGKGKEFQDSLRHLGSCTCPTLLNGHHIGCQGIKT